LSRRARHVELRAVSAGDFVLNCKAQTRAGRLRRIKRLEHVDEFALQNAGAGVDDRQHRTGSERHLDRAAGGRRIDRVRENVDHELYQPALVAVDHGIGRGACKIDRTRARQRVGLEDFDGAPRDVTPIDARRVDRAVAADREHPAHDGVEPVDLGPELRRWFVDNAFEPPAQELDLQAQGVERVADLVRRARSEPAYRGEPLVPLRHRFRRGPAA
jgi:hypothetical protein